MRGILFSIVCCVTVVTTSMGLADGTGPFKPITVFNALRASYGERIEDMGWEEGELYFTVRGSRIYFMGGRMLSEEHKADYHRYDPILYRYPIGYMQALPEKVHHPTNRSTDFLDALVGDTEREVVLSSGWVNFFKHRIFVHDLCKEPLRRVESRIAGASLESPEVRDYVDGISIIFSMDRRKVDGSDALSYHAYGLALDIVPHTYGGKQVYWRWSAVWKNGWDCILLTERWQPPQAVIDAFEGEGFVWGGKWYHFDTIHFEYRPEIILLNRRQ
jgi:hypothetical protein